MEVGWAMGETDRGKGDKKGQWREIIRGLPGFAQSLTAIFTIPFRLYLIWTHEIFSSEIGILESDSGGP